ncbi:hypothetical protein EDD17DRAFT_1776419 [Pisolithus thermaeus]|nr:hypothetical protein EDD17DRAFT_1776419 [Pisolithus thermaeus]
MQAEMPARKINMLLDVWAASLVGSGGQLLFTKHTDLYCIIDSTHIGDIKWDSFAIQYTGEEPNGAPTTWMSDSYEVWYHDPHEATHNILTGLDFTDQLDYVPYWEYDVSNDERHWQDFMTGDWAWEQVDGIISDNPTITGATLVPIILSSDKMTMLVATGQTDYYPLYPSIRNVHNTLCHAHCNAVALIGFLAMPKTMREHASTPAFHKFNRQLFHLLLTQILYSLHHAMMVPEMVLFGDNYYWHIIFTLTAYIADYEEQVLLLCSHEHCDTIIEELKLHQLWVTYGIVGDILPFTNDFPCADIHEMLSPDILHQLTKGGFKDHLVDWVECYLVHKILDDIDQHIPAVAPFTGLWHFPQCWHFKQWTGDDSKGLVKVYITAIEGHIPKDVVHMFWAFLKFCYLHYHYLICQFSAPNGLCSSITELKHIKAIKCLYQCTNCFQTLRKMLLINQRLNKLTAVHADFKGCGMLNGTCLSQAFEVLGIIEEGADTADNGEEQTASYEEESGESVDDLMAIDAQVSLACKYREIHVYNSACSTFFTPSNLSGIYGMCHEYICSAPMWRNMGPCFDCIFIITDPQVEGMSGLDVTCYQGILYSCAVIHWFDHVRDGPDPATGMWVVHPGYLRHNL